MNKRKNLLFSKREKIDKSTSMGEETENEQGMLGIPKDRKKEANIINKAKDKEKKIERASNEFVKNATPNLANLINENDNLKQQLESLEKEIEKERKECIEDIKKKDKEYNQKNSEIKMLSNEFMEKLEILKNYEKNLEIKTKNNSINKMKSDEKTEKEIKLIEEQIKIYEVRVNIYKKNYNLSLKNAEIEKKKEDNLEKRLKKLNKQISSLEEEVHSMRKILRDHQKCPYSKEKLLEKFRSTNKAFQYEIRLAKQLALLEISEENKEDINKENKEENDKEKDDEEKAFNDIKNVLPKIQNLKFQSSPEVKLESKIIKINKIGMRNSQSNTNTIDLYNKINSDFNDNERYIKEANKSIHINNIKTNIRTEGNYLFNEYEKNILQRLLPKNLINSYKDKFNNILKEKNDIKQKFNNESYDLINNNLKINNERDFNNLRIKEINQQYSILNSKYLKIKQKVNNLKANIKEIKNKIIKEEEKLKLREKDRKRIDIYLKGLKEKQINKNNKNNDNQIEENET